ncbi:hypothetical protein [Nonomuraea bangladeshensis]
MTRDTSVAGRGHQEHDDDRFSGGDERFGTWPSRPYDWGSIRR